VIYFESDSILAPKLIGYDTYSVAWQYQIADR
jgi:hypothetical protein